MKENRRLFACKSWMASALMLAFVGISLCRLACAGGGTRGQVRNQGGVSLKKGRPEVADPLAMVGALPVRPAPGTFHYTLRLRSFDGAPLAATYYPSKLGSSAPVVMLIHEMGRSRKDFEDAVLELRGQGFAEHLQGLGYAVFSMDLRGQGQNPRGRRHDTQQLVEDLQAGYFFLVDRHNRGDLNLAKLGVLALGDGANLAAAWAFQPGAAVTTEGRPSDLIALVLVSPKPEGSGYVLGISWLRLRRGYPSCFWRVIATTRRRMPCNPSSKSCSERGSIRSSFSPRHCMVISCFDLSPSSPRQCFHFLRPPSRTDPSSGRPSTT